MKKSDNTLEKLYHKKQLKVLTFALSRPFFLLINSGAKRAGKTVINNDLFLMELKRVRANADKDGVRVPKYILAGADLGSVQRNVLDEITEKYGITFTLDKKNSFVLFGVRVYCFGHSKKNDLNRIRGMTAYGAYVNEATLANKLVFDEILSRCSARDARILADTNPDAPNHWLMTNYIKDADGTRIKVFHFSIYDNDMLDRGYIDNIVKTTPSGMLQQRYIEGKWTTAEGIVYQDFNDKVHYITASDYEKIKPTIANYFAGVDWGYSHYGSIVVFGETEDGTVYLVKEVARQYEEIDFWVEEAKKVKAEYGNINFWADSARPEHVQRFKRERLRCYNANKSVLSGIEQVGGMIKGGRFYYVKPDDDSLWEKSQFKDEIFTYAWNKDTGVPLKVNDDTLDAVRYALYNRFLKDSIRGKDTKEARAKKRRVKNVR